MQAAKAAGAVVSFDLNFREKLWNVWGGGERARGGAAPHRSKCRRAGGQRRGFPEGTRDWPELPRAVKTYPAIEDRGHQPARSAFGQPAHLERDGLDRRPELCGAEMRIGCLRSRGRRRRILGRILLRPAGGRISRRCCSSSAGRTARWSPRFPATPPWRRWIKCARSPKAARREFSTA